ncbi:iq and ubiquitin-like domain-containing [Phytophthora cinnamomi]|uniref:iq and ubiquitin-like domain-containing n=1 Tax=Phytophthora cinnamomi TaxID=4785 RepID=UPI00355A9268|nr:iq and ubiquitin-like domain-containing [Phytophthora cinnamomi]
MDSDEQQPVADDEQHPEMSSDEPATFDEAEDPATPEENEKATTVDESGEPSSVSEMAMAEFLRASSEQLEGSEFSLLVVLQPDNVRHRVTVTAETTIGMLRKMLCSDLHLNAELVNFPDLRGIRDVDQKEDELPLSAYGLPSGSAECTLEAYVARPPTTSDYVMPARIQVQVYNGDTSIITVEIEKFAGHKPYLGGFRHRKTQQHFHHASTQTILSRARRNMGPVRFHRETQTQELVTRSLQTHRESGTQMSRRDLKLDESFDRHVMARPYFDSYQLDSLREDSVLLMQRLWRGFRARLYVYNIREQRRRVSRLAEIEAQENEAEDVNRQRREVNRRMHPNTVSDFEVLYNELDKWRQVECRKVREQRELDPSERQNALDTILAKETKLLQTIDRLKLTATDANRKQRIEAMLQFMARPKQWQMSDGGIKEVHTPFTVRAKELMDLYHGLRTPLNSVDERLDMLLHIKWTVQEFDCALTRELVELIDREADMLSRGRKEKSLEGLRKRLTNLFLQFIETPEFNPEAAALKHARA